MKYILVGNPNVGKTTFFNLLTDANNKVTNFAGTTVDIVERKIKGTEEVLIDIPGIRALSHDSEDEYVAIQTLIKNDFEKIINIIDSVNLKRNLYLTIQLLETGRPISFILNMNDELEESGINIDLSVFKEKFGQATLIAAKKEKSVTPIIKDIQTIEPNNFILDYGKTLESGIDEIIAIITKESLFSHVNKRFIAIQLLSGNNYLHDQLDGRQQQYIKKIQLRTEKKIIAEELALSLNGLFFKIRRAYIMESLDQMISIQEKEVKEQKPKRWVDNLLLNKYIGIPIFLLNFYLMFYFTFLIGDPITAFLEEQILLPIGEWITLLLTNMSVPEVLISLLIDGAYTGFSTVIMFLPQIILVFIFLSVLEGSGYMSRAVILFDRTFSKLGLNGKALAPMMIGLGCNVPAIMAARTISDKKERMITQLIIPFISCAARLEIYILFVGLFFSSHQALIILFLNILGVVVALISAKLFSLSFFKKQENFFLVEIPPYRSVNFTYISKMTLNKVKQFINNAGKFIVIGSMAIWLLLSFGPSGYTTELDESFFALIGHLFAWIFVPLGFGTWQATSSLITGFLAKELVVAQIGVLLSNYPTVEDGIFTLFTPAAAISFMVFNLLYIPCLSTVAVLKQETKSWKWVAFSIGYSFVAAYIVAFIVYQVALLFL